MLTQGSINCVAYPYERQPSYLMGWHPFGELILAVSSRREPICDREREVRQLQESEDIYVICSPLNCGLPPNSNPIILIYAFRARKQAS
jgi:hypothetical protein